MFCFCRIPVALESRRSSRWGGGVDAHPLHPPPGSIPVCGLYATLTFPIMHHICPPKFCICFSFLLGITAVPREIENKPYAKFGGGRGGKEGALWEMWKWRIENMVLGRSRLHLSQFNTYVEVRLLCLMCLVFSSLCPITYISCDLENQRKISHGEPRA